MEMLIQVLVLAAGFTMLVKGADWFVDGAAGIAAKFGIPPLVIGLTIVAMGTSAPEAAVSITSAIKGNAGITVGNVVGSNIINVLVILGIASLITPIAVGKSTVKAEIPFMLFVTGLLLALGYSESRIGFSEGVVLWAAFLIYLVYLFWSSRNNPAETEEEQVRPVWRLLLLVAVGMGLILWGSDLAVDAASAIARMLGMSDRLIGLTIVALGTSLPELVTSVSAARKGEADIAIGNIVGSNIFNLLFVTGTTALITPVAFEPGFVTDTLIAAAAGILLWICVFRKGRLSRTGGGVMLAAYAAYFVYLVR